MRVNEAKKGQMEDELEKKQSVGNPYRPELTREDMVELGKKGGAVLRERSLQPKKSIGERLEALEEVSMSYFERVVQGKEERPNAVRLNACRGVMVLLMKKRGTKEKSEKKKLGGEGKSYEEMIKTMEETGETDE